MSYTTTKYQPEKILEMSDDELFSEMKKLKRLVHKQRRSGQETLKTEVEICYLQAEAQKRGHKIDSKTDTRRF